VLRNCLFYFRLRRIRSLRSSRSPCRAAAQEGSQEHPKNQNEVTKPLSDMKKQDAISIAASVISERREYLNRNFSTATELARNDREIDELLKVERKLLKMNQKLETRNQDSELTLLEKLL
jgi:hypothetical protein